MEPIGVVRASPSEVSKRGSDALTFVLMQEKEKAKASKDNTPERPVKRFHSLLKNRSKLKKNSSTETTSRKSSYGKSRDISPPISRSRSSPLVLDKDVALLSSPGATSIETSFGSPESDLGETKVNLEEKLKEELPARREKEKQNPRPKTTGGGGFMKNLLRRNSKRISKKGVNDAASIISHDLDLLSLNSAGTETVRHRNSARSRKGGRETDTEEPREMRKRATRYKKRAMKLMSEINIDEDDENDDTPAKDPKEVESIARKAYKYAAESRRLFDLAAQREKVMSQNEIASPPRLTNISEMSVSEVSTMTKNSSAKPKSSRSPRHAKKNKASHRRAASCSDLPPASDLVQNNSIIAEDETQSCASFTQEVELEEHMRKMKELELFTKKDLLEPILEPKNLCGAEEPDLAPEYTAETKRLIKTIDKASEESDLITVSTRNSAITHETSASEIEVRLKHKSKMQELELWDAKAMWDSVLETLKIKSVEEEPKKEEVAEPEKKEPNSQPDANSVSPGRTVTTVSVRDESEDLDGTLKIKSVEEEPKKEEVAEPEKKEPNSQPDANSVSPGRTVTTVSVRGESEDLDGKKKGKKVNIISVIESAKIAEPMQRKFASMKRRQKNLQDKVEKHVESMQLDRMCSSSTDFASKVQNAIVDGVEGSPCRPQQSIALVDSDSESCSGSESGSSSESDDDGSESSDSGSDCSSKYFDTDSDEEDE
eukprot:CAMPEP_0194201860 /NCGR_PEP_ID=MMETSP0156-20130528/2020_1 /TAXON_ID=33649 /ORGANISM="Thalassionema nitzschioides, Strain L26-B" /LENGTH=715 /DNA_ID=CAMNT_0038927163 /DNA_START=28 /DNA_END=2172 /DNA_ORIENTATION=+